MKVFRTRLFGKYYLFTALVVLVFVAIGLITSRLAQRFSPTPLDDHHAVFYAKLLDSLSKNGRVDGLARLNDLNAAGPSVHLNLVDADGRVLAPQGDVLPYDWSELRKPTKPYGFASVRSPFRSIVLLPGPSAQYLSAASTRNQRSLVPSLLFSSTFLALAVSVMLGIGLALVLLFQSVREKAAMADTVIAQLQAGNLKARFPITRMDEVGRAMGRFNRMAEEIERLVEQLKDVERARMRLLQDLAHDLRTPIASLKNLLETLQSGGDRLNAKTQDELVSLSTSEVAYLERLVEDLLMLAQVSEPRYHAGQDLVTIGALLVDEAESAAALRHSKGRSVAIVKSLPAEAVAVRGNALLLRRMIRNVLENALSFATSEVRLTLALDVPSPNKPSPDVVLTVEDDGPGFTPQTLESYGERRATRIISREEGDRLSVGLGSVISRTVAEVHGGHLEAQNRRETRGACVIMRLPTG